MKLVVDKDFVEIQDITRQDYKELSKVFECPIPNASHIKRNMPWNKRKYFTGVKKFILSKKFRRGLLDSVISEIHEWKADTNLEIKYLYKVSKCKDPNKQMTTYKLRDYQKPIVDQLVEKECGIVKAATNSGKQVMLAAFLQKYRYKTLVLVHRTELCSQLIECFKTQTDLKVGEIRQDEFKNGDIIVAMVQTLSTRIQDELSLVSKGRLNDLEVLSILEKIKCVCIDEGQHITAAQHQLCLDSCVNRERVFAFSGTPFKTDNLIDIYNVIEWFGPVICEITNEDLDNYNVSSKAIINIIDPDFDEVHGDDYTDIYYNGIENNILRNTLIINTIKDNIDKQTLTIVNTDIHGEELLYLAEQEQIPDFVYLTGSTSYKKREKCLNLYKKGKLKHILSTTIFDEGINLPNIEVMILAAGGKSQIRSLQRIGRGLRKAEMKNRIEIYDFFDTQHEILLSHFKKRFHTYEKEKCFKIKLRGGSI